METCTCPIRPNMTYEELMREVFYPEKQCCSTRVNPARGWICSTALRELERAKKEKDIRDRYQARKGKTNGPKSTKVTLSGVDFASF